MDIKELAKHIQGLFAAKLHINFDVGVLENALSRLDPFTLSDLQVYGEKVINFSSDDSVVRKLLESVSGEKGVSEKLQDLINRWNGNFPDNPVPDLPHDVVTKLDTSTAVAGVGLALVVVTLVFVAYQQHQIKKLQDVRPQLTGGRDIGKGKEILEELKAQIGITHATSRAFDEVIAELKQRSNKKGSSTLEADKTAGNSFRSAIQKFNEKVKTVLSELGDKISKSNANIREKLAKFNEKVKAASSELGDKISKSNANIREKLAKFNEKVKAASSELGDKISKSNANVREKFAAFSAKVKAALSELGNAFSKSNGAIKEKFAAFSAKVKAALSELGNAFSKSNKAIKERFAEFGAKLKAVFVKSKPEMVSVGVSAAGMVEESPVSDESVEAKPEMRDAEVNASVDHERDTRGDLGHQNVPRMPLHSGNPFCMVDPGLNDGGDKFIDFGEHPEPGFANTFRPYSGNPFNHVDDRDLGSPYSKASTSGTSTPSTSTLVRSADSPSGKIEDAEVTQGHSATVKLMK